MYCSSCGAALSEGLSYCNRCGAEVNATRSMVPLRPAPIPDSIVWAIVAVSVGGLGVLIALMAVMKHELNFNEGLIILFSLLSFLLLLGAEAVFIWLVVRAKNLASETPKLIAKRELTTKELGEKQAPALHEPASTVTEQTTRTLDPVYRNQK
jgi:hypothetical protein